MLPSFARDVIRVYRPNTKTVRGVEVRDFEGVIPFAITGCSVQPASTSRNFASARVLNIEDAMTLYAPPGADIQAGDRIGHGAFVYEVDGDPEEWTSPTGAVSNVQFTLRRWQG